VVDPRPKRTYRSPRRELQALATRMTILDAAQRRFEHDGYPGTTIETVASDAAVSTKTVYLAFTTKAALLRAVWDRALKGDTDDAGVAERAWFQQLLAEPDPRRQVQLVARNACVVKRRIGALLRAIRSAAAVDADSGDLWQLIQTDFHANQRAVVQAIADHDGLRAGLDISTATDILWTLNHPDVWLLLTDHRGWTPERFEHWLDAALTEQLLGLSSDAITRRPGRKPADR
jgi:AcrR family transcriptional regulator